MSNFVSLTSPENEKRLKNLFLIGIFIGFNWILFHFTIIYIFGILFESILLLGLFLGFGNFISLFIDIPIGSLQKYIKPKVSLIIAISFMIMVAIIFIKLVYFYDSLELGDGGDFVSRTTIFLNSSINILLLIISGAFYGIIKEAIDVTIISYIFNNSTPSEYAKILSRYNILKGLGMMSGLIFSGILLALDIKLAVLIFIFILVIYLLVVQRFFDNKEDTLNIGRVKSIRLDILKSDLLSKKDEIVTKINTKTLIELTKRSKVVLLKPVEVKNSIDFEDIKTTTILSLKAFINIFFSNPRDKIMLWFLIVIMLYGFWDTFVVTYLVEFLNKILADSSTTDAMVQMGKGWLTGYVLLGILVIPAFLFQGLFIALSNKIGVFRVIMIGNVLSAISLVFFGLTSSATMVAMFGIFNSMGYAATMPLAQATISTLYNESYAQKYNLKEIDPSISRAPLMIILNSANVIGLLLGSLLVMIFGFNLFFVIFGMTIGIFFVYSISKMTGELKKYSSKRKEERKVLGLTQATS